MSEQRYALKNWLMKKGEGKNWGWQVIVDTLAIGESLPLRIVSYTSLRDLYSTIVEELRKPGCDSCKYDLFKSSYPDKSAWDNYVKKVINWATDFENNDKAQKDQPNLQALTDLADVYPLIAPRIFPILPANPFPMEMLSRISFNEYRVYCLLWFYNWIIIEGNVPENADEKVYCKSNALSFRTMQMASQWIVDNDQVYGNENKACKNWLMIIGPILGGRISMLSEAEYDKEIIGPVVKFIENFSLGISQEQLFHRHRFRRAAHEAAHLSRAELKRRLLKVNDALKLLLESDVAALNKTPTRHDLFHMSLWALFSSLRTKEVKEILMHKKCSLIFHHGEDYISGNESGKKAHEQICLAVNLDINNFEQLIVRKKSTLPSLKNEEIEEQISEYGFLLQCDPENVNDEALHELRAQCSRFYSRAYRNSRAQDGIRLMIISDRLHRELGGVSKPKANALKGICSWLSGLLRSESTVLYRYSTHKNLSSPFKKEDKFSLEPSNEETLDFLIRDMEEATQEGLKKSLIYRAVNENCSQICLMYDPETQQAIPKNNTLFHSLDNKNRSFRSAIAVPVRFNGRRQGAIEVSSYHPWQFAWGQQVLVEQAASVIAPYFYHHRFLEALEEINTKVLKFHHEPRAESELYGDICSDLANMFLCDGAGFWVRNNNEKHILKQTGYHNIQLNLKEIDLNQQGFISDMISSVDGVNKRFIALPLNEGKHKTTEIKDLFAQEIQYIALVPLFDQTPNFLPDIKQNKVMAIALLYARDEIGFKDTWNGVMHYMAGFLPFVVEAVNAFIHERKAITDVAQHEIWHDASILAYKAAVIARKRSFFAQRLAQLTNLIQSDWFLEQIEKGVILGPWRREDVESIRNFHHSIESTWFLPQKDMQHYAKSLKTRINALFNVNKLNKENKRLSSAEFDRNKLLAEIGDSEIVDIIMTETAVDGEEKAVNLHSITNRMVEKNVEIKKKGLYFETIVPRNYEIWTWPSIMDMVLRNLLENAIKYSLKNTVITFEAEIQKSGGVNLSFTNEGVAMDDLNECSEEVLQKYIRGSNSKGLLGMGMGLYIVQKMCAHVLKIDFRFRAEYLSAERQSCARYDATLYIPPSRVKRSD